MANADWEIGFCEIGQCGDCIYSCFCPGCAIAQARSNLDGSNCCFNFCNIQSVATATLMRSAYGMQKGCCMDCLFLHCGCCMCRANQIYQTSVKRPLPTKHVRGRNYNTVKIMAPCSCKSYCYACWCGCCALSSDIQRNTEMTCCTSCCCMTPMAQYQVLRYQYTIEGSDECGECYTPCAMSCVFSVMLACVGLPPSLGGVFVIPYTAWFGGKMLEHLNQNGRSAANSYLGE